MNLTHRLILEALADAKKPISVTQIRNHIRNRTLYPTRILGFGEHVQPLVALGYVRRQIRTNPYNRDPLLAKYSIRPAGLKVLGSVGRNHRGSAVDDLEAHPCA